MESKKIREEEKKERKTRVERKEENKSKIKMNASENGI